jgi:hypothetical protein
LEKPKINYLKFQVGLNGHGLSLVSMLAVFGQGILQILVPGKFFFKRFREITIKNN